MEELKIDGGGDVDVIITAGVEALGRNIEMQKINTLMNELGMLANLVGQERVSATIDVAAMTSALVANSGVASKNFILSKSAQDQNEINAKQEAMASKMIDPALQGAGQQAGAMAASQI